MPASTFRAGEVLDMAVWVERQGVDFYTACLKTELPERVKAVFQFLLDQETRHIQTFQSMGAELSDHPVPKSYAGEAESYLRSFVRNEVFSLPENAAGQIQGVDDPFTAIDFGLEFEHRSIHFYEEIQQIVPESERGAVERVIDQEHSHIRRLEELREELSPS
jgi:rubrerythrin